MIDLVYSLAQSLDKEVTHGNILKQVKLVIEELRESNYTSKCSWSPFGFLIVNLGRFESLGLVRLHIWPKEERKKQVPDWPIHHHSWFLRSWVISGNITNTLFSVTEDEKGTNYLYEASYKGNVSILKNTGIKVSCRMVSSATYSSGQGYSIPLKIYHSTSAQEGMLSATIVLLNNLINENPYVVGCLNCNNTYSYDRQVCDFSMCDSLIQELYKYLL